MGPVRELDRGERPRDWAQSAEGVNDVDVAPEQTAPARLSPQRFGVPFTTSEEYVQLVAEARALLSHSAPRATLDEIHLRAMRALVAELKKQKYAVTAQPRKRSSDETETETEHPRQRGRHVPAAVRRAVVERDAARCTYADGSGQRCRETHRLELHHLKAFAQGGEHTEENLTLRCHAHNALAAEEDFGRDFIELERGSNEHETWATRATREAGS